MKKTMLLTMSAIIACLGVFAKGRDSLKVRDTLKVREVGLVFSSLNSFGLCYKFGNKNTVFRITALSSTGTNSNSNYTNASEGGFTDNNIPPTSSSSFSAGLNFGVEKRKKINDRFYFYYGLVLIDSYTESKNNTTATASSTIGYFVGNTYMAQSGIINNNSTSNAWTISSGLGIVVGVAYKLNRKFSIGAELIPSASYSYNETKTAAITYNTGWLSNGANQPYTFDSYPVHGNSDKITKGITYSVINTGANLTLAYRIK